MGGMSTTNHSGGAEHLAQQYDAHASACEQDALRYSQNADMFPQQAAYWTRRATLANAEADRFRNIAKSMRGQK